MEHMYEIDEMPPTFFKETGNLGINGIVFEEKYGGSAMGYVETLLAYETSRRVSNALSMTLGASQTLCFDNFRRNASEEHENGKYLPKVMHGRVHWLPGNHGAQCRIRCHEHGNKGGEKRRQVHNQRQQDHSSPTVPLRTSMSSMPRPIPPRAPTACRLSSSR